MAKTIRRPIPGLIGGLDPNLLAALAALVAGTGRNINRKETVV